MSALTIANMAIRQDAQGRYCLNDLHRAAGGDSKHQPANWLRLQQTQDLAAELDAGSIPQNRGIQSKQGLGTFVAKELVYAYAMWISPAFHLKVIRAYDATVSKPAGLNAGNLTRKELILMALKAEEEVEALQHQVEQQAPKVAYADALLHTDDDLPVRDVIRSLKLPVRITEKALKDRGVILRNGAPAAAYVQKGYLRERIAKFKYDDGKEGLSVSARVTPVGIEFLRRFAARHVTAMQAVA